MITNYQLVDGPRDFSQHRNIAATLQKYFIARLQHCKNIAAIFQQRKNVHFKNIDT